MGKVYKDQTALKIDLNTGINLTTGIDSVYIRYVKPGAETQDEWTGSIEDDTHITKILSGGELDTAGEWIFWSYVIFTDLSEAPGEPVELVVYEEGT